jgi:hypothetical protein
MYMILIIIVLNSHVVLKNRAVENLIAIFELIFHS